MIVFSIGMCGSGVADIQANLNKLGFKLKVDGKYGPATRQAVTDFQKGNGLKADGITGPDTQNMINRRLCEAAGKALAAAMFAVSALPEIKELEKFL